MEVELFPPLSIHEIGHRPNQEDALWPVDGSAEDRLFIVCDGMGGHEKGDVASHTVINAFGTWIKNNVDYQLTKTQVKDALEYAYEQLDEVCSESERTAGTTLALVHIDEAGVTLAHMGDSRIYHIRPSEEFSNRLLYQSRDHSLVFDLLRSGEISYEEMGTHPQKNVITKAIMAGKDNRMQPDIIQTKNVLPGDYFYICSDGMLERMGNGELVRIISSSASDEEKRQQLISATSYNDDNHTAWLIHVKDVSREKDEEELDEEKSASCNALNMKNFKKPCCDTSEVEDDGIVIVEEKKSWMSKLNIFKSLL